MACLIAAKRMPWTFLRTLPQFISQRLNPKSSTQSAWFCTVAVMSDSICQVTILATMALVNYTYSVHAHIQRSALEPLARRFGAQAEPAGRRQSRVHCRALINTVGVHMWWRHQLVSTKGIKHGVPQFEPSTIYFSLMRSSRGPWP